MTASVHAALNLSDCHSLPVVHELAKGVPHIATQGNLPRAFSRLYLNQSHVPVSAQARME